MDYIGLIVNPYAGSGGREGIKGSDRLRRQNPETGVRVRRFLQSLRQRPHFLTPRLKMGEDYLRGVWDGYSVIEVGGEETTAEDTREAVREMINWGVKLIVFFGGDGTARDIGSVVGSAVPVLGVPAGVKMHSGVFAQTPEDAATVLDSFLEGASTLELRDILDADEDFYNRGEIRLRYYGSVMVPIKGLSVPAGKSEFNSQDLGGGPEYVADSLEDHVTYIISSGSTAKKVLEVLGYRTNPMGIDVLRDRKLVASRVDYNYLKNLTPPIKVIVTPIGGQGFILGRGNQEIGPEVLARIGKDDIIVISSREKVMRLPCLRMDSGNRDIDLKLQGTYRVIVGYEEFFYIRTCSNT